MRLLVFLFVCILAHIPKDGKKHDHGHPHPHHAHDHSVHDSHSHPHSHSHENVEKISSLGLNFESPFKPYLTIINSHATEQGPLISASVSSILTTTASFLIFIFIWFIQKFNVLTEDLLSTLTSFASGALLGDVFLHLLHSIPQSTFSSLLILAGILGFFVLDRLLSHNHGAHEKPQPIKAVGKANQRKSTGPVINKGEPVEIHQEKHEESALLLLLADFLHNTTDGMAIGASYAVNPALGISTTIAIFLHEIAHEVGDFIAFLKFGVSLRKALLLNLLTGLGSLLGCIISIYYGSIDTLTCIVLPVVAGNFLYVSLISMLAPMKLKRKTLVPWEMFFFCLGVGLMVLIEELE